MESDAWPMRPERILADLRAAAPRDSILCTDVGWNKNGMAQQYPIYTPGTVFTPGGFATMGFGAPAALGAKMALPDKVVVALIGDGGFGQNPAMLATAFEEDIAVVWVIMNNHAFGTIAGLESAHYGTTFGTVFEKNGKPLSPTSRHRAGVWRRGVKVDVGRRIQASAAEGHRVEAPGRARRVHEERAGADGGPLEHHGHLLARQEGSPRRRRVTEREDNHGKEFSLAHLTVLGCAPPEMTYIAARAGYDYVSIRSICMGLPDEPNYALADNPQMLKQTKRALAETGVRVHDIELARVYEDLHPTKYLPAMEVAAELGAQGRPVEHLGRRARVLYREVRRDLRPGQAVRARRWTSSASPSPRVRTLAQAVDVLHAVNRSNAGLMIDMHHFHRARDNPADLDALPREWFHFAQLCDAPAEIPADRAEMIRIMREARLYVGEGGIDVADILAHIPRCVYSIEVPNRERHEEIGYAEHATRCLDTLKAFLARHDAAKKGSLDKRRPRRATAGAGARLRRSKWNGRAWRTAAPASQVAAQRPFCSRSDARCEPSPQRPARNTPATQSPGHPCGLRKFACRSSQGTLPGRSPPSLTSPSAA